MNRKYKGNFLKQVIAKIDFLSPIPQLKDELTPIIGDVSKQYFPIPEPTQVTGHQMKLQLGPEKPIFEESKEQLTQWHFYGKEREKHLLVTQSFMFIEFLRYDSFENFSRHFLSITDALFSAFKHLQVKRLGLRYINNIKVSGTNLFSWHAYLNRNLLSIFKIPPDNTKITRALHNLELNYGDYTLKYQYGMHNPDYPASIRQKIFVLDYDAYTNSLLANDEIHTLLKVFHDEIEQMFENSITDRLRGIMDA